MKTPPNLDSPYWVTLREAERRMLQGAYEQAGSVADTAKLLGVDYQMVRKRMKLFGISGRGRKPSLKKQESIVAMRYPGPGSKPNGRRVTHADDKESRVSED